MSKETELLLRALLACGGQPVPRMQSRYAVDVTGSILPIALLYAVEYEPQELTVHGEEFFGLKPLTSVDWYGCKAVVTEMERYPPERFWSGSFSDMPPLVEIRIQVRFIPIID